MNWVITLTDEKEYRSDKCIVFFIVNTRVAPAEIHRVIDESMAECCFCDQAVFRDESVLLSVWVAGPVDQDVSHGGCSSAALPARVVRTILVSTEMVVLHETSRLPFHVSQLHIRFAVGSRVASAPTFAAHRRCALRHFITVRAAWKIAVWAIPALLCAGTK